MTLNQSAEFRNVIVDAQGNTQYVSKQQTATVKVIIIVIPSYLYFVYYCFIIIFTSVLSKYMILMWSTVILPPPLIQKEQLSVNDKRMFTK